jgi:hypothetical protein
MEKSWKINYRIRHLDDIEKQFFAFNCQVKKLNPPKHIKKVPLRHNSLSGG